MNPSEVMKQEWELFLSRAEGIGQAAADAGRQVLIDMAPEFDQAIVSADPNALGFVRDRTEARFTQIAGNAAGSGRDVLGSIITTVIRAAIVLI